jgi:tRNA nucleotidyltransferase (CCA-adding enzyme)
MKIFLVGGAVRDQLLNYPTQERDWVVIGETLQTMLARGFIAVGKDFPVFLHPQTHEEYALARTERKTAAGYKGFVVHASPEVSLEADLQRRDLTINAMALSAEGELIDPYGGQTDLHAKIFRHVSPAFSEDPVRVLRVARFAARYAHLGFTLAAETQQLMQAMVAAGEVAHLVPERVWAELHKALHEQTPRAFFEVLKDCHALAQIFPELDNLFGVPQVADYHPEIDTGLHTLLCLEQATTLSPKPQVRLAALLHDLGKAKTPAKILPHHYGHEQAGLPVLLAFCQRLRVPNEFKNLAQQVMTYHTHCHKVFELRAATLTDMLLNLGAFKKGHDMDDFLLACTADARGRLGLHDRPYPQADYIRRAVQVASEVDTQTAVNSGKRGAQIGEEIRRLRIAAIAGLNTAQIGA